MQLKISQCYFSQNFHWIPSKLYENVVTMDHLYAMRNWHLVPKITYSI